MYPDPARKVPRLFFSAWRVCLSIPGLIMLKGLLVSLLPVATQVREMSLSCFPRLFATLISMIIFGPWRLRRLSQFVIHLWAGIPAML